MYRLYSLYHDIKIKLFTLFRKNEQNKMKNKKARKVSSSAYGFLKGLVFNLVHLVWFVWMAASNPMINLNLNFSTFHFLIVCSSLWNHQLFLLDLENNSYNLFQIYSTWNKIGNNIFLPNFSVVVIASHVVACN